VEITRKLEEEEKRENSLIVISEKEKNKEREGFLQPSERSHLPELSRNVASKGVHVEVAITFHILIEAKKKQKKASQRTKKKSSHGS
jgi:hypothetical protein